MTLAEVNSHRTINNQNVNNMIDFTNYADLTSPKSKTFDDSTNNSPSLTLRSTRIDIQEMGDTDDFASFNRHQNNQASNEYMTHQQDQSRPNPATRGDISNRSMGREASRDPAL